MVLKSQTCCWSKLPIYPGRGLKSVSKDGTVSILHDRRIKGFFKRGTKAQSIRWTSVWRHAHKKGQKIEKRRRAVKCTLKSRCVLPGLSEEDIARKKAELKPRNLTELINFSEVSHQKRAKGDSKTLHTDDKKSKATTQKKSARAIKTRVQK